MATTLFHEIDTEDFERKLNTVNLALKSISAYELKRFNELTNVIGNNDVRIQSITASVRRVTNLVNNLTYAAKTLIALEKNAFIKTSRTAKYQQANQEWKTQTGYDYA